MDEQQMKQIMVTVVGVATDELTDFELAVLNNVVQLNVDPHGRDFDYDKIKALFTEKGGTRMHNETKLALSAVVNRRLAK